MRKCVRILWVVSFWSIAIIQELTPVLSLYKSIMTSLIQNNNLSFYGYIQIISHKKQWTTWNIIQNGQFYFRSHRKMFFWYSREKRNTNINELMLVRWTFGVMWCEKIASSSQTYQILCVWFTRDYSPKFLIKIYPRSQHLIIICDNLMCDSDDMIQDKYYTNKKLIINSDRVSLGLSHGISQLVTGSYSRYLSCFMIVVLWYRRNIDFFFCFNY